LQRIGDKSGQLRRNMLEWKAAMCLGLADGVAENLEQGEQDAA
jgi:hypothetical protein